MNVKLLLLALLLVATSGSAQTSPPPANPIRPAAPTADRAQLEAALAQAQARATNAATATNRPAVVRPSRPAFPALPTAAPAAGAAGTAAPGANLTPQLAADAMTLRPAANAGNISDPDRIYPAGSIDWPAASLEQVLQIYSELVGRNLLRPSSLSSAKADIVLKQSTPLTKLEVVQMIEAALYLNQISVVNVGEKFVTIMPTAEAFKIPGMINTNLTADLPVLGSMMTHVVQLKYTKPTEMVTILTPFASGTAPNPILPVDSSGILVLRDNVANVKRMLEMIEKVDVVAQSEIISEVIPIKYAKAEEIATALSSVGGQTSGTVGTRSTSSRSATSSRTGGMNQPGQYGQPGAAQGFPGAATPTPTPSSSANFGDRVRSLISRAATAGDFAILGETKIIADIRSNSLLVFATRADMEMIKEIVAKLDVVLAQVLIETVIMDVSMDDKWSLGVSAAQTPKQFSDNFSGAGGMNLKRFTDVSTGGGSSGGGTNAYTDLIGTGLRYFGLVGDDLYVQVEAAASDGRVNVIQKPRILTSHATPASLFIGSTVPYVTGTYYGYGTSGGSSSYSQLRVGIGLDVTPFINQDGLVVMQIQETIDEVSGFTQIENVGNVPNTTSRTLSAEVAVKDGESIVLGGFIRNSDSKNNSGVPLLKDIPLLGVLFSSRGADKSRSELMVVMRPTVLRTPELAARHVDVERERLPLIRKAVDDLNEIEEGAAKEYREEQARKEARTKTKAEAQSQSKFREPTPFTPEEEELLLNPQP